MAAGNGAARDASCYGRSEQSGERALHVRATGASGETSLSMSVTLWAESAKARAASKPAMFDPMTTARMIDPPGLAEKLWRIVA
jgi:hypothetical protein